MFAKWLFAALRLPVILVYAPPPFVIYLLPRPSGPASCAFVVSLAKLSVKSEYPAREASRIRLILRSGLWLGSAAF